MANCLVMRLSKPLSRRRIVAAGLFAALLSTRSSRADDAPPKLPRFACLKYLETPLRDGPRSSDAIIQLFKRQHLPLEIRREYGNWRFVRDPDGLEGWIEDVKLESRERYVMVRGAVRAMRSEPRADAQPVARLEPEVLAKLLRCPTDQRDWCLVRVGQIEGWLDRSEVWGVYSGEVYPEV